MVSIHRIWRILPLALLLIFAATFFSCGKGKPTGLHRLDGKAAPKIINLDRALAELDALPLPKGVDPALFTQLKGALRAALLARGTNKVVCTPPTGLANHIPAVQLNDVGGGMFDLIWRYYNVGDYNQDGTVGIADITPLAMHYGETWVAGEENGLPAVIDGSGNGAVDIADVTPIAMNFGVECASYAVQSSDAENGTFALVDNVYLDTGTGKDTGRIMFTYNFAATPALWYRVVAQDNAFITGEGSGALQAGAGNQPPVADIQTQHYMGYAPLTVILDAGGSYDPDGGAITLYEWDENGDGVFEGNTGTDDRDWWEYTEVGDYTAAVRVTDDEGAQATASMTINVYPAPDYDEVEENDARDSSATPLPAIPFENFTGSIGEELPGYIGYDGDWIDYFSFNATEGQTLTFVMSWGLSDYGGSLAIIDSDGDVLWLTESNGSPTQLCYTFVAGDTAPFYLEVYNYWGWADYLLKGVEGSPPVADLVATPTNGPTPLSVSFDASGSTDVVDYSWDFLGDGTLVAGGATTTHDYPDAGWYRATVHVTDADGLVDSASVLITAGDIGYDEIEDNDMYLAGTEATPLPAIPFSGFRGSLGDNPAAGYNGYDGDYVDYYRLGSSEGDTITVTCNFDSATAHPSIALYDSEGDILSELGWEEPLQIVYKFAPGDMPTYYLGVSCNESEYTDYTIDIEAGSAPTADVVANPLEGAAPLEVTFDARWSYDYDGGIITTYDWDWDGDGTFDETTVEAYPVMHTFTADALYQTILRVTDEEGQQDEDVVWIFIPNAQAYYDEVEPNDNRPIANALPAFPFTGWHGSVGRNEPFGYVGYDGSNDDCLLLPSGISAGSTLHIQATGGPNMGELNISLWDAEGTFWEAAGDPGATSMDYTFTGSEVAPYYLQVRNVGGYTGDDYWLDGSLT